MASQLISVPSLIQLESSTACNARCKFCPRSRMKRAQGNMSDELYLKIIDDAYTLGIKQVLLFLNGEPTLFKRLVPWLLELRARSMKTVLFTNGSYLTHDLADELFDLSNVIDSIVFSVSGKDDATHQSIMGLDHRTVLVNIRYFVERNAGRIKCEAHMPLYSETAPWADEWRKYWKFVGHASTTHMYNWGGKIVDSFATAPTKHYCDRLNHLTVLWDGRVALCCMDIDGEVILGDLNTQSITEVFNSPIATSYRESHRQGRWGYEKLCETCNMNL
jgi:hypothetical protein